MRDINASPLNPLPWVVWLLATPMALFELAFKAGEAGLAGGAAGIGWRVEAIQRFGFSGRILDWMLVNRYFPAEHMIRFVTYPFFQGGFTQAVFVTIFILALGKMTGEVMRPAAVLAVFFGAAIVGALAWGLLLPDPNWLIGGFPAVYGLVGAFTCLIWARLAATGGNPWRAFVMIGTLLGIQLFFGLIFGSNGEWLADLAGFATGFGLTMVMGPGGWQRTLERIRAR